MRLFRRQASLAPIGEMRHVDANETSRAMERDDESIHEPKGSPTTGTPQNLRRKEARHSRSRQGVETAIVREDAGWKASEQRCFLGFRPGNERTTLFVHFIS
jgi:hypothetical protein